MTSALSKSLNNLMIFFFIILAANPTVIENNASKENETNNLLRLLNIYQDCDCGPNSISCRMVYRTRECTCKEGYAPYKTLYLREETCKKCDCGPNASSCEFGSWNGNKQCTCKQGYGRINYGEETCVECDCGNGTCSLLRGGKTCECFDKFAEVDGRCEACDCGKNSVSCKLKNGIKDCTCKSGYAAFKIHPSLEPTCEVCECGDGICEFVSGFKKCNCNGKKVEVNGKCEDCDCGPNSISCKLDYWSNKQCTCKDGYSISKPFSLSDESCKECNCGSYGTSCRFDNYAYNQKQKCECNYDGHTSTQDGKCKECDCGPNSDSCYINYQGVRRCSCHTGYVANTYYSWEDEYCNSITPEESGSVSGWRIGTYIIAVLFVVIIIALLVGILNKNANRV